MTLEIIRIEGARSYPPRTTAFTEPYWRALAEGCLQTTRCLACTRLSYPPKPICPHCWTDQVEWTEIDPHGTLYSWTRIHAGPAMFAAELPYEVGIVDLTIGLRIAVRLVAAAGKNFTPGLNMRMVVMAYDDGPLLAAMPA
jgi:uncharacterized protein